jgi:hypothetical protein
LSLIVEARLTPISPALWRLRQEDERVQGQPELHNKTLSQKIKNKYINLTAMKISV